MQSMIIKLRSENKKGRDFWVSVLDYDWIEEIKYDDHWQASVPNSVGTDNRGKFRFVRNQGLHLILKDSSGDVLDMSQFPIRPSRGASGVGFHNTDHKRLPKGQLVWTIDDIVD